MYLSLIVSIETSKYQNNWDPITKLNIKSFNTNKPYIKENKVIIDHKIYVFKFALAFHFIKSIIVGKKAKNQTIQVILYKNIKISFVSIFFYLESKIILISLSKSVWITKKI